MLANATKEKFHISPVSDTTGGIRGIVYPAPIKIRDSVFIQASNLMKPLMVNVERTESGEWIASHPIILTHGYGRSKDEAAVDFIEMVFSLYSDLSEDESILAPHLLEDLNYLREYISGDV